MSNEDYYNQWKESEACLQEARRAQVDGIPSLADRKVAMAQVHATLALAAATASRD